MIKLNPSLTSNVQLSSLLKIGKPDLDTPCLPKESSYSRIDVCPVSAICSHITAAFASFLWEIGEDEDEEDHATQA